MDISGKVALVTGGAGGIGKALVEILLQKHVKAIYMVDVDEDGLKLAQQEFEKEFNESKVHICKCDVSSEEQMEDCFKNIMSTYGELHIVCNNAGICDEINWGKMLAVNLSGVIIGTKLAVQYMQGETGGGGVIINTSSHCGLSLHPAMPVYATTKWAIIGFTRQIATFDPVVVKKKIRVNVICPHGVYTPLLTNLKVEKEYQPLFTNFLAEKNPEKNKNGDNGAGEKKYSPNCIPQELAPYFVKLIEEPSHGETLYVRNAEKSELVADEAKAFRDQIGCTKGLLKLRDFALK